MKRYLLLILLALIGLSLNAQSWQWAENINSGNAQAVPNSITTDIHGRVYVTGQYIADTIIFGNDSLINITSHNAYIVKYDNEGNVIWARGSQGNCKGYGSAIISDDSGYVYVTGYFNSAIDTAVIFGNDTLSNPYQNNANDIYVIKYDSLGNIKWTKRAGGTGNDQSTGIAVDKTGNVYVSGFMNGSSYNNDSLTFGSSSIHFNGHGNMFLLKYSSAGIPVWAMTQGGVGLTEAHSVASDSIGNVYVTGTYINSAIIFGPDTLTAPGTNNYIFLTKFNSSGNVIWSKGMGSTSNNGPDNALSVVTDRNGNVFISGSLKGTTTFGTYTLTVTGGSTFMFIAKYDSSGTALWAKSGGLGTYNTGYGMITDPSNNVYVTGTYHNGISFDSTTSFPTGFGLFVVKYNSTGTVIWAKNATEIGRAHV